MTNNNFPAVPRDDRLFYLKDELDKLDNERNRQSHRLFAAVETGEIDIDEYEAARSDIAARCRHVIEEILSCTPATAGGEGVQFRAIASLAYLCESYENGMDHFLDIMAKFAATRSAAKQVDTHESDPPVARFERSKR
jgi:hypothetical protein